MNRELQIILVKFVLIVAGIIIYISVMMFYVAPMLVEQVAYGLWDKEYSIRNMEPLIDLIKQYIIHQAYGQSAFDNSYGAQQQYGNQQFDQQYQQPYQYDQFNQQYQQPYQNQFQQYGTPTYSPYGMQPAPAPYPSNTVLGFGIQEIVTALIAGGGATAYARRRTNSLEADKQLIMAEMLKDKQRLAELARVSYEKMPKKGFEINDAPSIKLDTINNEIDKFTEKTAQA